MEMVPTNFQVLASSDLDPSSDAADIPEDEFQEESEEEEETQPPRPQPHFTYDMTPAERFNKVNALTQELASLTANATLEDLNR